MKTIWTVALAFAALCALVSPAAADGLLQSSNADVDEGNRLLDEGKPGEALESYDQAAKKLPGRHAVHLNRGLALTRMGDDHVDLAMQAFNLATDAGAPSRVRARALSGLGNLFFKKEDYKAAIEHYKKSLMARPGNKDVAWNLELARARKEQQEEQQQEQQKDEQQPGDDQQNEDGRDQQDQEQQKDEQQPGDDQQKEDGQNQQDQQQKEQEDEQKKQQEQDKPPGEKPQEPAPQPKTKQEIEQILNALDNQQDNLNKQKARQGRAMMRPSGYKDW